MLGAHTGSARSTGARPRAVNGERHAHAHEVLGDAGAVDEELIVRAGRGECSDRPDRGLAGEGLDDSEMSPAPQTTSSTRIPGASPARRRASAVKSS